MSDSALDPRLLALVLQHAPCWLAIVDRQHQILRANAAFTAQFGPAGSTPCHRLLKGRDEPCEPCVLAQALATGAATSAAEQGLSAAGTEVHFRVEAVPLPEDPGRVLLLATDVTRETELGVELAQVERLASVGLTTAGLAHTIKNVLAGLQGGMYMMSSGLARDDAARVRGAWEMVEKYLEQVGALVGNMLSYAKPDQPDPQPVAADELLADVVQLYESKAAMVGIDVALEVPADLAPVAADRARLHSCLANLISNAVDACAWDPSVDKAHVIHVRARSAPGRVLFEVEDNGMGISEENQAKLLRASFTTKGIRGTGLGLLLTKKIAEEHGGSLAFQSTPGQGTTFTLALPTAEPAEPPPGD